MIDVSFTANYQECFRQVVQLNKGWYSPICIFILKTWGCFFTE